MSSALSEITQRIDDAITEAEEKIEEIKEEIFSLKQAREKIDEASSRGGVVGHVSKNGRAGSNVYAIDFESLPEREVQKKKPRTKRVVKSTVQKILGYLGKCRSPRTVRQIAEAVGIAQSNVTPYLYVWNKHMFRKAGRNGSGHYLWTLAERGGCFED